MALLVVLVPALLRRRLVCLGLRLLRHTPASALGATRSAAVPVVGGREVGGLFHAFFCCVLGYAYASVEMSLARSFRPCVHVIVGLVRARNGN